MKSAYDHEDYVHNLADNWLDPADIEARSRQESQRYPNIPFQEKEWHSDPGEKDRIHISTPHLASTPISDLVTRKSPPREYISSAPAPSEIYLIETA